jgi:hypothetical protein
MLMIAFLCNCNMDLITLPAVAAILGAIIAFATTITLGMRGEIGTHRGIPRLRHLIAICIGIDGAIFDGQQSVANDQPPPALRRGAREGLMEYLSHQIVRGDRLLHGSNKSRAV